MIRFYCRCGAEVFFENTDCVACGCCLGFEPGQQRLVALLRSNDGRWIAADSATNYRLCEQRQTLGCNWLLSPEDDQRQCPSCRTTRTIPTLSLAKNQLRWQILEQTKRRALYMILRLGLPMNTNPENSRQDKMPALVFDFLEDRRSNPDVMDEFIYSGHQDGVITINAAEADDSYRATHRELMNELYRTLLGHFRHELGHYYGLNLSETELAEFRQYFGDERLPYQSALDCYYEQGADDNWRDQFISAYASSHPWEDWAETWAHYLHISDTLETALAYGIINEECREKTFEQVLSHWAKLTVALNALNRSMGVDDAYPFVISPTIRNKLSFIDRLVTVWRASGRNAAATGTRCATHHASNA